MQKRWVGIKRVGKRAARRALDGGAKIVEVRVSSGWRWIVIEVEGKRIKTRLEKDS